MMKLTKKIFAAAAVFAAATTLFVGCKGLLGNADDIESKGKREKSSNTILGKSNVAGKYTRFYAQFGTSENVYAADCDITFTGTEADSDGKLKTAAGFMFGIHTDKDSEKKMSSFIAAVRIKAGQPQFYVSHFSNYTNNDLKESSSATLGTEDATWSEKDWTNLTGSYNANYKYDTATKQLTVKIHFESDTTGNIIVRVGNNTVTIAPTKYASFRNEMDFEEKQTATIGCVIGRIACYGVIASRNDNVANQMRATWKVSNDKRTIGPLFAEEE